MVFRRRMSQLRPIHSLKHVIDSQGGTLLDVKQLITIAQAVDAPTLGTQIGVETGSKINAFYLNVQVVATTQAAIPNIYMIIYKNPGGNIGASAIPNANVQGVDDFKRQIFHTEMRMMANSADTKIPITLFNGVIKIPKVFKNMRINDVLQIQLFAPGVNFDWCVQCIYKEYR